MSKDAYKKRTNPFNNTLIDDEMNPWEKSTDTGGDHVGRIDKMKQEMNESEHRQVDSTQRCLESIAESEQIGRAAAEELVRQGEVLDNIESKTENIKNDLKISQKHISNIRSPFAWIKRLWNGDKDEDKGKPNAVSAPNQERPLQKVINSNNDISQHPGMKYKTENWGGFYDDDDYDESSGGRSGEDKQFFKPVSKSGEEKKINENLNKMVDGMTRLKELAVDIGDEIDAQNEQLGRLEDATDNVNRTMIKQNDQMRKVLK